VKFDNDDLMHLLVNNNVRYSEVDVGFIADKIANKGIVAYFEGGWEFGPRALGHRSFLADPRTDEMKSVMNEKIKHRERYRPFAPIVQKEYFGDYFLGDAERYSHMLFAAQCNNKAVDEIPAIVHVDCTARVQVCDKKSGNVYNIIDAFRKLTGVPVLINTSFNDNNEPIVLDPVDALSCFLRTNADVLVVNDIMIERSDVQDIDMLLKKAVDFQRSALYKKTDKAINELLNKNVFNIDEFISRELLSSLYFKFNDSYDRLAQEFFCKEVSGGVLVTDSYHLKVLNKMSCYYKKEIPFAEIVTVDDVLSSCIEVPENAYVLLYNVSVLMEDAEVRAKYPFLSSCTTFYSSEDRVVMEDMSMMDCKELSCFVKGTYEVDLNNSVDDYFKKSVYPVFVGRYLI